MTKSYPLLKCREICHRYSHSSHLILDKVSLTLEAGQILDLNGPSGCGKSTLLSILGGLLPPSSGEVLLSGASLYSLSRGKLSALHRYKIGFLFQHYFLLPDLTIRENILLKGQLAGMDLATLENSSNSWLDTLKLSHRADAYPSTLSGGEQQRAGLIRAIIHSPDLLLCDEPTGNLDSVNRDLIIDAFQTLRDSRNMGIIIVSHDPIFKKISDKSISLT